jgi:hypothetical protein
VFRPSLIQAHRGSRARAATQSTPAATRCACHRSCVHFPQVHREGKFSSNARRGSPCGRGHTRSFFARNPAPEQNGSSPRESVIHPVGGRCASPPAPCRVSLTAHGPRLACRPLKSPDKTKTKNVQQPKTEARGLTARGLLESGVGTPQRRTNSAARCGLQQVSPLDSLSNRRAALRGPICETPARVR